MAKCLGHWQVPWVIAKVRIRLLEMNWNRIMNYALDPDILQSRSHSITLWRRDDVTMPYAF